MSELISSLLSRTPRARSEMTSDSANTAHWLLTWAGCLDFSATAPSSRRSMPRIAAAFSKKRPVPAAHLSFITNSTTLPVVGSTLMAFESCPPMSMIVRAFGMSACAPIAWQLISVTT